MSEEKRQIINIILIVAVLYVLKVLTQAVLHVLKILIAAVLHALKD